MTNKIKATVKVVEGMGNLWMEVTPDNPMLCMDEFVRAIPFTSKSLVSLSEKFDLSFFNCFTEEDKFMKVINETGLEFTKELMPVCYAYLEDSIDGYTLSIINGDGEVIYCKKDDINDFIKECKTLKEFYKVEWMFDPSLPLEIINRVNDLIDWYEILRAGEYRRIVPVIYNGQSSPFMKPEEVDGEIRALSNMGKGYIADDSLMLNPEGKIAGIDVLVVYFDKDVLKITTELLINSFIFTESLGDVLVYAESEEVKELLIDGFKSNSLMDLLIFVNFYNLRSNGEL